MLLTKGDTLVDLGAILLILAVNGYAAPRIVAATFVIHTLLAVSRQPRPALRLDQQLSVSRIAFTTVIAGGLALSTGAPYTRAGVVAVSTTAASMVGRTVQVELVRTARRRRLLRERVAVIGDADDATALQAAFDGRPELGVDVDGYVDLQRFETAVADRTEHLLLPDGTDGFLVPAGIDLNPGLLRTLRWASTRGNRILIETHGDQLGQGGLSCREVVRLDRRRVLCLPSPPLTYRAWLMKRAADIVFSAMVLAASAPLLLVCAMAVKVSSRGPVLFRQPRVGFDGRPFTMLKFRTFPIDHVDERHSLDHHECPIVVGRFLRRTSLDELPQLWNVLTGSMSVIGPRPERVQFATELAEDVPGYHERHRVPGGITGLAQVSGYWGNSSITERVRLDNEYIDNWSIWLDLRVLFRTLPATIRKGWGTSPDRP